MEWGQAQYMCISGCELIRMARRVHIHDTIARRHMVLRVNGGQDIFFDGLGRIGVYNLLEEVIKRSIVCVGVRKRMPV